MLRVTMFLRLVFVLFSFELLSSNRVQADAGSHFDAGVRAFEEQRFADAASEFEQAYALNPAWQVLYNLGTVYAAVGRPVDAVSAFERYLAQADTSVSSERRREVELELHKQRAKIGWVEIRVNRAGAEVRVDAKRVGNSPLPAATPLAAGTHTLDATISGAHPERRDFSVEPGQTLAIEITLTAPALPSLTPKDLAPVPKPQAGERGTVQRVIGWTLGGAGLAGAIVGSVIVTKGHIKHLDAVDLAKTNYDRAEVLESEADHQKTLGFATIGVSAAVFVAGAIVLLTAPSGSAAGGTADLGVSAWVSNSTGGVLVRRSW